MIAEGNNGYWTYLIQNLDIQVMKTHKIQKYNKLFKPYKLQLVKLD